MKRKNYFLRDSQIADLEAIAAAGGPKVSEQIRRAVDDYLAKQKRESKKNKKDTDSE